MLERDSAHARWLAWYNDEPDDADWPDGDWMETMEHYIVRNDIPKLIEIEVWE